MREGHANVTGGLDRLRYTKFILRYINKGIDILDMYIYITYINQVGLTATKEKTMNIKKPASGKMTAPECLAMIENQIGLKLRQNDHFNGVRKTKKGVYIVVDVQDPVWMSSEFSALERFTAQSSMIKVEACGNKLVAIFADLTKREAVTKRPAEEVGETSAPQEAEPATGEAKKASQAERVSAYLAKRQARVDRILAKADRREKDGQARLAAADHKASFIPFGQPILVGHHSEKRHRRDLEMIRRNTDKGFASLQEAKRLRAKALTVEENAAIFSDDPAATEKLEAKIERLEQRQALMKAVNTRIRAGASFQDLGFSEEQEKDLTAPSRFGGMGFPGYKLTNNNANIRRLKARLQNLRKREEKEAPEETVINGARIVQNLDTNRVQMVFPGKPSEVMRNRLKKSGFRWSPFNGCWQRHLSDYAVQLAKELAGMNAEVSEEG